MYFMVSIHIVLQARLNRHVFGYVAAMVWCLGLLKFVDVLRYFGVPWADCVSFWDRRSQLNDATSMKDIENSCRRMVSKNLANE